MCNFLPTLIVILELGLRVPQELPRLEVVAGLDAAVEAAEGVSRAVDVGLSHAPAVGLHAVA